jgi:hypothetical protein
MVVLNFSIARCNTAVLRVWPCVLNLVRGPGRRRFAFTVVLFKIITWFLKFGYSG